MRKGVKQYKKITNYIFIIMEKNNTLYLKTDNNTIINETSIIWVKKMNDCLEVCAKSTLSYLSLYLYITNIYL